MKFKAWYGIAVLIGVASIAFGLSLKNKSRLEATRRRFAKEVALAPKDHTLHHHLKGRPLADYLLLPPKNYDPKKTYALWICLHGDSGRADYGESEIYYPAQRRPVFLLAPQGSTRMREGGDFSNWNIDKDPDEIVEMIDDVTRDFNIDPQRVAIFGSSGGCRALWKSVARHPDRFRFIATFGAGLPTDSQDLQDLKRASDHAEVVITRGGSDDEYPQAAMDQTERTLRLLGFKVHAQSYPGLGHYDRVFRNRVMAICDPLILPGYKERKQSAPLWSTPLAGQWHGSLTHRLPALKNGPGHKVSYPDPGISAQAMEILKSGKDRTDWPFVKVPQNWHEWPGIWSKSDGEAIFMRSVNVPTQYAGKDLELSLGPVSNYDDTFFNGQLVGHTDHTAPYYWVCERLYKVPAKLVRPGQNVIAVRIFDGLGGGGFYGGPSEDIKLSAVDPSASTK